MQVTRETALANSLGAYANEIETHDHKIHKIEQPLIRCFGLVYSFVFLFLPLFLLSIRLHNESKPDGARGAMVLAFVAAEFHSVHLEGG
jgi:hypothetical protein